MGLKFRRFLLVIVKSKGKLKLRKKITAEINSSEPIFQVHYISRSVRVWASIVSSSDEC